MLIIPNSSNDNCSNKLDHFPIVFPYLLGRLSFLETIVIQKFWCENSLRSPKSGKGLTTKITDTIVTEGAEEAEEVEEVIRTEKIRMEKKTIL